MPPPISNDGSISKQHEAASPSADSPGAKPATQADASKSASAAASPQDNSYASWGQDPTVKIYGSQDPVGMAKILPVEGSSAGATSSTLMRETAALQRPGESFAPAPTTSGQSQNQRQTVTVVVVDTGSAPATPRSDRDASDAALKHIISNMSDQYTATQQTPTNHTSSPPGPQNRDPAATTAAKMADAVLAERPAHNDAIGQNKSAASVVSAEGLEHQASQMTLLRTGEALVELRALVDALVEPLVEITHDPLAEMSRQLDARTIRQLAMQAAATDLGRVDSKSAVYVLNTVPPTIVEDNGITKQFTIFAMSGEMKGQVNHTQAAHFAVDLGDGKLLVLDPGGYGKASLTLTAAGRQIISALGGGTSFGQGALKRTRIDGKIGSISKLHNTYNDEDDCTTRCFIKEGPGQADRLSRPQRCVLCKHQ